MKGRKLKPDDIMQEYDKIYCDGIFIMDVSSWAGNRVKNHLSNTGRYTVHRVKKTTPVKCFCNWIKYKNRYVRRWSKDCNIHKQ